LWAEKYEERFADIFAVQDSIAKKVADSLALRLTGDEKKELAKHYTENTEAYRLYLLGRHFTYDQSLKGAGCFNEALRLDPNYALAYSGLADAYNYATQSGFITPRQGFLKAKEAALKALEIDNALPQAHLSLGSIKWMMDRDFLGADAEFKRACELDP